AYGDEERVIDVSLGAFLGTDHAAEGGEAGGHRPVAMLTRAAVRPPAVGRSDVSAAGRPRTVERRQPHVELAAGAGIDDDQVVISTRGRLRVARNVEADGSASVIERALQRIEA